MRGMGLGGLPLRWKMVLAALVPLALTLVLVSLAAFWLIGAWVVGETQKQVRNDLSAAREVLDHEERRVADLVRFTAHGAGLVGALSRGDLEAAGVELQRIRRREGLDLLTLADRSGRVVLRAANPMRPGGEAAAVPFLGKVLAGEDFSGTVLLDHGEILREGEELARRAAIEPRSPDGAVGGVVERRGMFLIGASAVHDAAGRLLGVLYGGVLLNNNLALVDRIKEVVYGAEHYGGEEAGSATIFLEDLRVATTVRLKDGRRAIGTRVSREVARAVLERGEVWLARARVVDTWYLTAYEPIRNQAAKPIGALYVGLLEEPFSSLKRRASLGLLGLLVLGSAVGYLVAHHLGRRVAKPILDLEGSVERIARGERDVTLPVPGGDEVGHLTRAFNDMSGALRRHEEELTLLNRELELKVAERTGALEAKSLELIRTQEELLRAEKLAAIGELAAGVAHEINNPAAIIRGNVEILLNELPPEDPSREEADEIMRQTERIALITRNMLAFAREQRLHPETFPLNALLEEILDQVGHQVALERVSIRRELDPGRPTIEGDRERLRQVFTNLVVNALQVMEGEGTLSVASRRLGDRVEIAVTDTGPGIPRELQEKIFNPFFTTKGSGTGLGLSISYGIVKAHRGSIEVESEPGRGTTFRVLLPAGPRGD